MPKKGRGRRGQRSTPSPGHPAVKAIRNVKRPVTRGLSVEVENILSGMAEGKEEVQDLARVLRDVLQQAEEDRKLTKELLEEERGHWRRQEQKWAEQMDRQEREMAKRMAKACDRISRLEGDRGSKEGSLEHEAEEEEETGSGAEPLSVKLHRMGEDENPEDYFVMFERLAISAGWGKRTWVARLAPHLSGKALKAYASLPDQEVRKYEAVKQAVLQRYGVTQESYRQKFRTVMYEEQEGVFDLWAKLYDLASKWLQPQKRSSEQIVEEITLERFIEALPRSLRFKLREYTPQTGEEATQLAANFLTA